MTIDSIYRRETFNVNAPRAYTFTFEHIGEETINVYEADIDGLLTSMPPSSYTLTLVGNGPLYTGGSISFLTAHLPDSVQVVVLRDTPETQLVDYQAYDTFPAETHEFALDKLTMIAQENEDIALSGGGSINPASFIPISGTLSSNPATGVIEFAHLGLGQYWAVGIVPGFGIDTMAIIPTRSSKVQRDFKVITTDGVTSWFYNFTGDLGQLLLPTDFSNINLLDTSAAASIQFVLDNSGSAGAFIPLAGTDPVKPVTGVIHFRNDTLSTEWAMGIAEGVTDWMTLAPASTNGVDTGFVLGTGNGTTNTHAFFFGPTGEVTLPDIDYSVVGSLGAVSKQYVDDAVAGSGPGVFVPLAGTNNSEPITGTLEFDNANLKKNWTLGWAEGIFDNLVFSTGVTTIPDTKFMISNQGKLFIFDEAGLLTVQGGLRLDDDVQTVLEMVSPLDTESQIISWRDGLTSYNPLAVLATEYTYGRDPSTPDFKIDIDGNAEFSKTLTVKDSQAVFFLEAIAPATGNAIISSGPGGVVTGLSMTQSELIVERAIGVADFRMDADGHGIFYYNLTAIGNISTAEGSVSAAFLAASNLDTAGRLCTVGNVGIVNQSTISESDLVLDTRRVNAGDGLQGGGTLAADRWFNVDSTVVRTSGDWSMGGSLSSNHFYAANLSNTGATLVAGGFGSIETSSSDIRLKDNIIECPYGLAEVMQLEPIQFDWRDDRMGRCNGFSAQDLIKVVPEAITHDTESDTYGVKEANNMIAVLVNAIKDQQDIIDDLSRRLAAGGL